SASTAPSTGGGLPVGPRPRLHRAPPAGAHRRRRGAGRGRLRLALPRGSLAALAPGRLLLGGRAALRARATGTGALTAPGRRAGRVGDAGRAGLRLALVLQGLVLLLVLDVGPLRRHLHRRLVDAAAEHPSGRDRRRRLIGRALLVEDLLEDRAGLVVA